MNIFLKQQFSRDVPHTKRFWEDFANTAAGVAALAIRFT